MPGGSPPNRATAGQLARGQRDHDDRRQDQERDLDRSKSKQYGVRSVRGSVSRACRHSSSLSPSWSIALAATPLPVLAVAGDLIVPASLPSPAVAAEGWTATSECSLTGSRVAWLFTESDQPIDCISCAAVYCSSSGIVVRRRRPGRALPGPNR